MKKTIALLLALAMVFSLCACGGAKDDEAFLKNVGKGLEKRFDTVSKGLKGLSGLDAQQVYYANCVSAELDTIGELSEYIFTDPELEEIAAEYVAALKKQLEGAKYYGTNHNQFIEVYSSQGYYPQMALLCRLSDNFGLTVAKKHLGSFNTFIEDGRYYTAVSSLLSPEVVLESLGGTRSQLLIENTSQYDLSSAQILFNFYDEDGVLVDSSTTYFESWMAGSKNKAEIYCQNKFSSAEGAIKLNLGTMGFSTGYVPITYVNNMIIELELVTELPQEFAYETGSGRTYSKGIITDFWFEDNYWNEGKASLYLYISGEKTFDRDGEEGTNSCYFNWKIYDEDGVVMGTGSFYTSKLKVGEVFKGEQGYASDLRPGKYFVELSGYSY